MKKVLCLILAMVMVLSLAACGSKKQTAEETKPVAAETKTDDAGAEDTAESTEPIRIAIVAPKTGNNAYAGEQVFNSAKMVIEAYNANGGYNGRMIEYDEYDTKADANEGVIIAQKLVAEKNVIATIGPWSSSVGLAMAPIFDPAGILMYATSPSHADLTKASEWVIRQSPLAECIAKGLAETLINGGYMNGVFLYDNTNEGAVGGGEMFEKHFTAGGETVALQGYAAGTKDFTPILTKYKGAGIDFINIYGATADSALICTQARDLDIDCLIQVNPMALNDEFNSLIAGMENIYCCDTYAADYPSEELQVYVSGYSEAYGATATIHGYLAYCAAERFCEALDKFGPDDMESIRDYLRNGTQETPLGTLEFIDGDADRPTVWSVYDSASASFKAVAEIPAKQ